MSDIMNDVISEGVMQQPQRVVFYDDQGRIRFALWAQVRSVRINQRLRVF